MFSIDVIIPTMATAERSAALLRAVDSIGTDRFEYKLRILVCVNGSLFDSTVIQALRSRKNVFVHQLATPSLPLAIAFGRSLVTSDFFCFLDDDDEYIENALLTRLKSLSGTPSVDFIVTNGIRRSLDGDFCVHDELSSVVLNPLKSLFHQNWLASCGALFRSSSIGQEFFDDYHDLAEWTWLAFCLCTARRKLGVVDVPTFIINDTQNSRSKSASYREGYIDMYMKMLSCDIPNDIRSAIKVRLSRAYHDLSFIALNNGDIQRSILFHIKSIRFIHGFKYLLYSRKIISRFIANI